MKDFCSCYHSQTLQIAISPTPHFHLYVRFDFGQYVLCPYLGKPVEREKFEERSVEDMGDYLRLTEGEKGQQGLRMKSKMVLQV